MVEDTVNPVHKQYMDLSGRYKAGWTFHRFIQGLRKFFGSQDLEDHTAEFQQLYTGLREVSKSLNDPDIQSVVARLDRLTGQLDTLIDHLDAGDRRVDPSLVRLFFQRVKAYDDRILLDLIRFYLEVQRDRSWESERIDKVDFLLTRLAEAVAGVDMTGDRGRLVRVLEGVSSHHQLSGDVDSQKVANRLKMIQAVRNEIRNLDSFEELTDRDLVGHYRHLKHGLGRMLFEKSVLPVVVDTNLLLASRIGELTRQEEKRILEDYEKVSRLAQDSQVDRELANSVNRLHQQVSHFRKQVGSGTFRLRDMAQIRRLVLDILGQVEESEPTASAPGIESSKDPVGKRLTVEEAIPSRQDRHLIGREFEELVAVLMKASEEAPEERHFAAQAASYRLDERELHAFDRLSSGESCDEDVEYFVLAGAALRRRVNDEVNELHSYRGRVGSRESPPSVTTLAILRLCDLQLRRYSHLLESELVAGIPAEARQFLAPRMRLMRDYSGLWLVAYGD